MLNQYKNLTKRELLLHIVLYAAGIVFMPMGVVFTINAHLGANGYDALNFALAEVLNINTSLAIYMTAFVAVVITALIRKGFPRLTTFISSFLLGIFTDIWKQVFENLQGNTMAGRILLFVLGALLISIAVASYVLSIFPSNPTDDLIVAMDERGINLGLAKILMDGVCVAAAFFLGGEIGVCTIIITFGLGPVINLFRSLIAKAVKLA